MDFSKEDMFGFENRCILIRGEVAADLDKIPCVKDNKMIYIEQCDCFQDHKDKTVRPLAYCSLFEICQEENMVIYP